MGNIGYIACYICFRKCYQETEMNLYPLLCAERDGTFPFSETQPVGQDERLRKYKATYETISTLILETQPIVHINQSLCHINQIQ